VIQAGWISGILSGFLRANAARRILKKVEFERWTFAQVIGVYQNRYLTIDLIAGSAEK